MKNNFNITVILLILISIFNFSCRKEKSVSIVETGVMTDIDGNEYKTIKLGTRWWMAENLKVTKFSNGTPIQEILPDDQWQNASAAYCSYENGPAQTGLLYNWNCISDPNGIAPQGWRIPTDDDWKELEKFLGMNAEDIHKQNWRGTNEGEKLKIEGTNGWSSYESVWPTNESGFSALAGSCRLVDGTFGDPGLFSTGFWWTASSYSENLIWYRYLDYKESRVYRSKTSRYYGFSIRCVKN